MLSKVRTKLQKMRQQPEIGRLRTASYLTLGTGIAISLLWLAVLLPAQIYFASTPKSENNNALQQPEPNQGTARIQGLNTEDKIRLQATPTLPVAPY